MPRKKQYQWDVETNGQEAPEQLSRSAKKRQSSALQDLGAELTKLPVNELDRLPLTPDLLEALRLYARISNREGKRRQLQFIGRLMREVDAGPLAEAIEARKNGQQADAARLHLAEQWREKLLSAAGEMANGPENIAGVFRDADLTFPAVTDGEGNERVLTSGTFVPLLMGSDRVLRKNAFEAYYNRLGEFKNTVAAALDGQFRSLKFFSDARHYPSTRAAALDVTEVPEEVYDNLIEAVHANMDKMYRYVALRKKLGLQLCAVHVHHGLRGVEADADEAYVRDICRAWDVPLKAIRIEAAALAKQWGIGCEEAGRRARYEIFEECLQEMGDCHGAIAVAHHRDDCAETLLFHMFRGTV